MERVSFYETHIFKYSRREGTRAAVMKDQVPEQIKAKRSAVLIGLGHEKQDVYKRQKQRPVSFDRSGSERTLDDRSKSDRNLIGRSGGNRDLRRCR